MYRFSSFPRRRESRRETQASPPWIPAFAGMTVHYFSTHIPSPSSSQHPSTSSQPMSYAQFLLRECATENTGGRHLHALFFVMQCAHFSIFFKTMYVDRCTAKGANGKNYTRYLLRESKRQGKKTLKGTTKNTKKARRTQRKMPAHETILLFPFPQWGGCESIIPKKPSLFPRPYSYPAGMDCLAGQDTCS